MKFVSLDISKLYINHVYKMYIKINVTYKEINSCELLIIVQYFYYRYLDKEEGDYNIQIYIYLTGIDRLN